MACGVQSTFFSLLFTMLMIAITIESSITCWYTMVYDSIIIQVSQMNMFYLTEIWQYLHENAILLCLHSPLQMYNKIES